MRRAPWVTAKPEQPYARGERVIHDSALGWRFINPRMEELYGTDSMGQTAENVAQLFSIDRRSQDQFAVNSHRHALEAQARGTFADELIRSRPSTGSLPPMKARGPIRRWSASPSSSPPLPPMAVSPQGTPAPLTTALPRCCSPQASSLRARGLSPMAAVRSAAVAGVPPQLMGMGPVPATRKALERARLNLADIELIELNEAFAAPSLAVLKELGLDADDERVNPNGGAIALGHPLGCSGSRILVTLIHELRRRQFQFGLATMCIGVGQGIAVVVENLR
jgi:acetyl-CoA acetyltransferase